MIRVGLTGGIGSGKSTVARIFEMLGVPVYYADAAAKRLMGTDAELRKQIISFFGSESYTGNQLNRQYLAREVFHNQEKLSKLNSLVHPATIRDAEEWMMKQTSVYAIKEAALIFESGSDKYLHYIIGVSAPLELRIHRTMLRDNISREDVLKRIQQQMDEDEKMSLCNFIVYNDEIQPVLPQVLSLHKKLQEPANEK
ncbi:MAG: dephospho-CoA kinase [Bacteroidetes bacterium]|nr:dephospho-CoA kinase [Bacteroidota bacterium]